MSSLRLTITGSVQGVGLRWATWQYCRKVGLGGWVQNEPDGTVTAVVSGPEEVVNDFLAWLKRGPAASHVVEVEVVAVKGSLHHSFSIKRWWTL